MRLKKFLDEGTWSHPGTKQAIAKLEKAFESPISSFDFARILYDYLGDDQLFDLLEKIKRENSEHGIDVRPIVAKWVLDNWLSKIPVGWTNNPEHTWKKEWDPEAVERLRELCWRFNK